MTRPDYSGWLTDEDVKRLVSAFQASQHQCVFPEEERQLLKDLVKGGRVLKTAVIYIIVGIVLYVIIAKSALIKTGQVMGLLK